MTLCKVGQLIHMNDVVMLGRYRGRDSQERTMQRFPVWMATIALAVIAGCQTSTPVKSVANGCSYRPADAGLCEPPSNFRLFDYIVGAK